MRITSRQLRQIIREELIREAGMGDVRVADAEADKQQDLENRKQDFKTFTGAWYDALDEDLKNASKFSASDLAGTGRSEGGQIIINTLVYKGSPGESYVSNLAKAKRLPNLKAMKPKLLANFDKAFSSLKGKINDNLYNIELRGEYAKWVDHALWLASLFFAGDLGAMDPMTDDWHGLDDSVSWLGQEIRRLGIDVGSEAKAREGLADMFLRGTEELTGVVKSAIAEGLRL